MNVAHARARSQLSIDPVTALFECSGQIHRASAEYPIEMAPDDPTPPRAGTTRVRVMFEADVFERLGQHPPQAPHRFEPRPDGRTIGVFDSHDIGALLRWLIRFTDGMTVLDPPELIRETRRILADALRRHRPDPFGLGRANTDSTAPRRDP